MCARALFWSISTLRWSIVFKNIFFHPSTYNCSFFHALDSFHARSSLVGQVGSRRFQPASQPVSQSGGISQPASQLKRRNQPASHTTRRNQPASQPDSQRGGISQPASQPRRRNQPASQPRRRNQRASEGSGTIRANMAMACIDMDVGRCE